MKTQIPRSSDQPMQRYSGVYEQVGRMIDSADWNELVEILKRHFATSLTDAVGSGTPRDWGLEVVQSNPGDTPQIQSGYIYADGVLGLAVPDADHAGLDVYDLDAQNDFPEPPDPSADLKSLRFYADVWERTVLAIEDEDLKDPGFHGADTCTRTQTMAQVKWCSAAIDPEDEGDNPKIGTAELDLVLHQKQAEADPCDPCADEVDLDSRVGNYLFRLEVHDVEGDHDAPSSLTLKWSSENAAEQHEVGQEPEDFTGSAWVYEFFDLVSERHLGLHHAGGFSPSRGVLLEEYPADPTTDLATAGKPYVRRWDGYVTLLHDGAGHWSLAVDGDGKPIGMDMGVPFDETAADTSPGYAAVGNTLELTLATLDLDLVLLDQSFLAGDFWLGMVREAVHSPDTPASSLILEGEPPLGIVYHYLLLAETDGDGNLKDWATEDTDRWRRLNFPPLSDLHATDVRYETDCPNGFFSNVDHDTVKKALDRLCELAAEHVAYTTNCPNGFFNAVDHDTVKKALDHICELTAAYVGYTPDCPSGLFNATDHDTVKKALDEICRIQATHVGFEPAQDCTMLKDAKTVWEALDILCKHSHPGSGGGGCKVTVGPDGGQFATLEEALAKLSGAQEACLCLLSGDHKTIGFEFDGIPNLCITGCGPGTRLRVYGHGVHFKSLASVAFEGIDFELMDEAVLRFDECRMVTIDSCEVSGTPSDSALVTILDAKKIQLHRNHLEALSEPKTKEYLEIVAALPPLVTMFGKVKPDDASISLVKLAKMASKEVSQLSQAQIDKAVVAIVTELNSGNHPGLSAAEVTAFADLLKALQGGDLHGPSLTGMLVTLLQLSINPGEAPALDIQPGGEWVTLTDNRIEGLFSIYAGVPTEAQPGGEYLPSFYKLLKGGDANLAEGKGKIQMTRNTITRMGLGSDLVKTILEIVEKNGGDLLGTYASMLLTDNTFASGESRILGQDISLASNVFGGTEADLASVIASRATYIGNFGPGDDDHALHSFAAEHKPDLNLFDMNFVTIETL